MIKIPGINKNDTVAIAMSGGVDSSTLAALLLEAGYSVIGVTLNLHQYSDINDAKEIAKFLNISHHTIECRDFFEKHIIKPFINEYKKGRTPNPCTRCNKIMKFDYLLDQAKKLGAKLLVTGHYARREFVNNVYKLMRAFDKKKDQSYFLFATPYDALQYIDFPLGNLSKNEIRKKAKHFGLHVSSKPDSQDICFLKGHYIDMFKKLSPKSFVPGDIVHINGEILGQHEGIIHFTIGQRRGLGVSFKEPLYITDICYKTNKVTVGPLSYLSKDEISLKDVNWLYPSEFFEKGYECDVQVRSTQKSTPATVIKDKMNKARVIFKNKEQGVAPGQACVFFKGDQLLGGGFIEKTM
ncbi:MAG: tRNA 2-thiouridine(34) synthase MnmA [Alphaproteobacteria bacterium]